MSTHSLLALLAVTTVLRKITDHYADVVLSKVLQTIPDISLSPYRHPLTSSLQMSQVFEILKRESTVCTTDFLAGLGFLLGISARIVSGKTGDYLMKESLLYGV